MKGKFPCLGILCLLLLWVSQISSVEAPAVKLVSALLGVGIGITALRKGNWMRNRCFRISCSRMPCWVEVFYVPAVHVPVRGFSVPVRAVGGLASESTVGVRFEGKKAEDRRSISSALGQLSESGADLINVSGLVPESMAENALSLSTVDYEISFLDPDDLTVVGISDFLTETRSY